MALSGACPGTVLAQVGVGIKSGFYALDGAVLAGVFWTSILRPILKPCHPKPAPATSEGEEEKALKLTVHEHIKCPPSAMLLAFEALCAAAVAGTVYLTAPSATAKISPILGGFLIGLSQLWSLVSRKSLLGASTAYEELATHALWLLKGLPSASRPSGYNNIIFASGMAGGAFLLGNFFPNFVEGAAVAVPPLMAVAGGFLMVLGARIAGGCTSGHGISGMSMFSVSSFVTIGTALAVGVVARSLLMPAFGA
ncbi:hypothetical protein MKZ38_003603 [Zalerion maritima]|uniref:Sulphur transport domain-containing protein n=1 Tax=Zalerion maritima TaxID=339359 RepID=A0AAD5RP05_9PEZI|nr:hypothetical protein MKZ38_003603 [Zalerion maritima]